MLPLDNPWQFEANAMYLWYSISQIALCEKLSMKKKMHWKDCLMSVKSKTLRVVTCWTLRAVQMTLLRW